MLHSKRIWSIIPAESAEWIAERLAQFTWCGCNGFRLGDYVFASVPPASLIGGGMVRPLWTAYCTAPRKPN